MLIFSGLTLFLGLANLQTQTSSTVQFGSTTVDNARFDPSQTSAPTTPPVIADRGPRQSQDDTFRFSIKSRVGLMPRDTELHLIGVYEGDDGVKNPPWWSKCMKNDQGGVDKENARSCHAKWAGHQDTEPVKVHVISAKPTVLVLMAYDPVEWTVEATNPDRIQKVILSGYHAQKIKGLNPSTPVEVATHHSSPGCASCTVVGLLPRTYKNTGKDYTRLLQKIEAKTGIKPTSFQGSYRAGEFYVSNSTLRLSNERISNKFQLSERDVIDNKYQHHFDIANVRIDLPEGLWKGLVYQSIGKTYGDDEVVVFYQTYKGELLGLFATRIRHSLDGHGFPKKQACADKVGYSSSVAANKDQGNQLCYWVEHMSSPWKTPLFELAAKRLQSRDISVPSVLINSAFHHASQNSSATGYYLTNPETAGISTQSSGWLASPWHPRKMNSDPVRKQFVDDKIDWMESWFQIFRVSRMSET